MTSAWEGFPLAVLEAMRAGLPVVAYDAGGLNEQIESDVSGLLVALGDRGGGSPLPSAGGCRTMPAGNAWVTLRGAGSSSGSRSIGCSTASRTSTPASLQASRERQHLHGATSRKSTGHRETAEETARTVSVAPTHSCSQSAATIA